MSKLWLKHQKFMKGNAGFSLVELIIVIAIMAALVAILAPQYLKYVEKSRLTADKTQLDEIIQAAKVSAADPEGTGAAPYTLTVVTTAAGVGTITPTDNGNWDESVIAALGTNEVQFKSKDMLAVVTITITVAATTFAVTATSNPAVLDLALTT
ncbi:MAG: prepilin-type N-terminal cleavage/methylation domain-containing protein [Clostridia bacterium]|nr:prepilin-type N-terminal cleavage/methylation domain-containing protein [Clostridia bacterium]NCC68542.1 prepilin-type N-terminal cleavage/methylation domain-containing protein [Clostridia bacterium]